MNILCPVSDEKTNEKIVRYIALVTFLIALVFIYNPMTHYFLYPSFNETVRLNTNFSDVVSGSILK